MDKIGILNALIDYYSGGIKSKFAEKIGVKPQTINTWLLRGSFDTELIYSKCEYISGDWLLTGEGEMMRNRCSDKHFESIYKENEQNISPNKGTLTNSTPKLADDPNVGKPYYDVDFIGGFTEIFNSQVSVPATNIVIRGFEKADLWCNVTGHSMEPKINHGDIIVPFANVRWMMSSMAKYTLLCLTRYEPSRYCASLMILTSSVSSQSTCKISMNKNTPNQGY